MSYSERFRPSTVALALSLVVGVALLYGVDRSIAERARAEANLEVIRSALLVERFLALHTQMLLSLRSIEAHDADEEFEETLSSLASHAPAYRRVWLADSAAVVRRQHYFGGSEVESALPLGVDLDTLQTLSMGSLVNGARRSGRAQVSRSDRLFDGDTGFAILVPLYRNDVLTGYAGGAVPTHALLRSIGPGSATRISRLVLVQRGDTMATGVLTDRASSGVVTRAVLTTPGGDRWEMMATHVSDRRRLRLLLWGVGLSAIFAVALVMRDERRQARRLAERTQELERLSTELLRANRAKSTFLANVSHELRTPLNAIVGFVDLLREGVYGELSPRQVGPVDRIASSATHLRHLVDQVLDIAKMAAGRLEVHPEAIELRPFVLEVVSEVEALINERGLNLSLSIPTTLPRVRSDPLHLRQILVNLLGNAIQYTISGGIAVRSRLVQAGSERERAPGEGEWVALQVADTGIGIAVQDSERIFEEFEQVNAGPRTDAIRRGTGLGLAISRRLARLMGGEITVESEINKGSTFTVWLPIVASGPRTTVAPVSAGDMPAPV